MAITVDPNDVRGAIDTSINSAILPDPIISGELYAGTAIREVQERDPDYEDREPEDLQRLNNAAALITAALIIIAFPSVLESKSTSLTRKYNRLDVWERAAELRARADGEISAVTEDEGVTSSMPTMFALGIGRRGL